MKPVYFTKSISTYHCFINNIWFTTIMVSKPINNNMVNEPIKLMDNNPDNDN